MLDEKLVDEKGDDEQQSACKGRDDEAVGEPVEAIPLIHRHE
jgi:hypothetical protein